jgi:hypothetical protein
MTRARMTPPTPEPTLAEVENDNQHQSNSRFAAYVASSAFFGMFITPRSLPLFLGQLASKVILPIAAFSSISDMYFKMREYMAKKKLDENSSGFYSLVVDGLMNVGILASIGVAYLATAATAIAAAPIILVTALFLKSAWELAMAAKDAFQAFHLDPTATSSQTTLDRKNELNRSAAIHFGNSLVTGVIGLSVSLMAFAGYAAFAYLGLAASGMGAVIEARTKEENSDKSIVQINTARTVSSTSQAAKALGIGHGFHCESTFVPARHYDNLTVVQAPSPGTTLAAQPESLAAKEGVTVTTRFRR